MQIKLGKFFVIQIRNSLCNSKLEQHLLLSKEKGEEEEEGRAAWRSRERKLRSRLKENKHTQFFLKIEACNNRNHLLNHQVLCKPDGDAHNL